MNHSQRLTNALRRLVAPLLLSVLIAPAAALAQEENEENTGQAENAGQAENESPAENEGQDENEGTAENEGQDENAGQDDLDEAIRARIDVNSYPGMTKVVELAQAALNKGLNEANQEIAKRLLAGMLMDRASFVSSAIIDQPTPSLQWRELRKVALADLRRLLAMDPNRPGALFLMGRLLSLPGGDQAAAISALDKAIDRIGDDNLLHSRILTLRGNLQTDDEARRLADYEAAIKIAPDDPEPFRTRALYFLFTQKTDEAIVDLDRAIELDGEHAATHETRGRAFFVKQDFDEALASFARAQELSPESPSIPTHRSRLYAAQGDFKAAVAELDKAIGFKPNEPTLLLMRSQMRMSTSDGDGALADIEEVIKLRPGNPTALRMRAEILRINGKMDEAIAGLESARKTAPGDQTLMLQLGVYYSANKQLREAIETFDTLLGEDAKNWQALRSRGDAHQGVGDLAKALADYNGALELQPNDTNLLNNLSWLLSTAPDDSLRDGSRAMELALKACELTEYNQAHILSTLAAAHAEQGDFKTAIEWSEKSVALSEEALKSQLTKELDSYKESKPWRDSEVTEEETPVEQDNEDAEPADADSDAESDEDTESL